MCCSWKLQGPALPLFCSFHGHHLKTICSPSFHLFLLLSTIPFPPFPSSLSHLLPFSIPSFFFVSVLVFLSFSSNLFSIPPMHKACFVLFRYKGARHSSHHRKSLLSVLPQKTSATEQVIAALSGTRLQISTLWILSLSSSPEHGVSSICS